MTEILKDPLWSLMLSTNGCYPGCGCKNDWFDLTQERVDSWVQSEGADKAAEALGQLAHLKDLSAEQCDEISHQTNQDISDFAKWFEQWEMYVRNSIDRNQ